HRSKNYNDAPMPYSERLTWDGVALHAGGLPGYPSSHGCVHLPTRFAELLFAATAVGMTVVIASDAVAPVAVAHPPLLSPVGATPPRSARRTRGRGRGQRQAPAPHAGGDAAPATKDRTRRPPANRGLRRAPPPHRVAKRDGDRAHADGARRTESPALERGDRPR